MNMEQAHIAAKDLVNKLGGRHWRIELSESMGGYWSFHLELKSPGSLRVKLKPEPVSAGNRTEQVYSLVAQSEGNRVDLRSTEPETLLPRAMVELEAQLLTLKHSCEYLASLVAPKRSSGRDQERNISEAQSA